MGRHIEELYSIQMSVPEAVEYLMSRMPAVLDWADAFLHLKPQVCPTADLRPILAKELR
jgi:DNA replication ATP-dependent helicase Dna2